MRHFLAAFLILLTLAYAGAARANPEQSRTWFEGLTADERSETQANLTLLGHYTFLVDGQYGAGTYKALTSFQRSLGRAETGVLIPRDRDRLMDMAAAIYSELGMDLVRDREGQSALILPVGLLSVTKATRRGNSYSTPDNGIALETIRRPASETGFRALFDEMNAADNGRSITYSSYNDGRFVVSGHEDGRLFYAMFQNTDTDSVGYSLSWTEPNDARANMLAVFIASYFQPLRYMPAEEQETKIAETPSVVQAFGVFTLPAGQPDVIMLNGEVTHSLASDFNRALAARPSARIVVLNSPGGYVDNALRVARLVRERGMSTLVAKGMGCYSACAYIFFAGASRWVEGELGVHQISAEVADLVMAQTTLGDVLDALDSYGVEQTVISVMLKTPPQDMYIFTMREIADLGINLGGPILIADLDLAVQPTPGANSPGDSSQVVPPANDTPPVQPGTGGTAYVQLALQSTEAEANRSLEYARERWAGLLAGAAPEIERLTVNGSTQYRIRVPARSMENANALCAAIKSAGGGCFVTSG
jgi:hypothetical protein